MHNKSQKPSGSIPPGSPNNKKAALSFVPGVAWIIWRQWTYHLGKKISKDGCCLLMKGLHQQPTEIKRSWISSNMPGQHMIRPKWAMNCLSYGFLLGGMVFHLEAMCVMGESSEATETASNSGRGPGFMLPFGEWTKFTYLCHGDFVHGITYEMAAPG